MEIKLKKGSEVNEPIIILGKKAIDKVMEYRDQGRLKKIVYEYVPVKEIDYVLQNYLHDWDNIKFSDFYDWDINSFRDFYDEELKTLPEFEEAAKQIHIKYGFPLETIKGLVLYPFIRLIMDKAPNQQITYENIDKWVYFLIKSIDSYSNKTPTRVDIELRLINLFIESNEIEIAPSVFLRKPNEEQLAIYRPKPSFINERERYWGYKLPYDTILSFSIEIGNGQGGIIDLYYRQILFNIDFWLNIFRLYKPSEVIAVYQIIRPDSIFDYSISESIEGPHDKVWKGKIDYENVSKYSLYLKKQNEEDLQKFISALKDPMQKISNHAYLKGSYLELAYHRYMDALLKTELNAYRVLSCISSLEALFSDGNTEITFKIKLRVAKILSFLDYNAIEVSDKLKKAYDLRSKLVHGSKLSRELLDFAKASTYEILNYNRICLIIFMQLESLGKLNLVKEIDNALIDTKTEEKLRTVILAVPIFKSKNDGFVSNV